MVVAGMWRGRGGSLSAQPEHGPRRKLRALVPISPTHPPTKTYPRQVALLELFNTSVVTSECWLYGMSGITVCMVVHQRHHSSLHFQTFCLKVKPVKWSGQPPSLTTLPLQTSSQTTVVVMPSKLCTTLLGCSFIVDRRPEALDGICHHIFTF